MKTSRSHLFLSILILLMGMLFSCENSKKELETIKFDDSFPNEITRNVTLYYSDSAKVKVMLNAPLVERYYRDEDSYAEFNKGVYVEFYDDSGHVESTIESEYAKNYDQRGEMFARNDVVVVNKKGEKLNTEHLEWNRNTHQIRSNSFVRITTKDEIIYGNGLEANEDFTRYKVKDIKGIIEVDQNEMNKDEDVQ